MPGSRTGSSTDVLRTRDSGKIAVALHPSERRQHSQVGDQEGADPEPETSLDLGQAPLDPRLPACRPSGGGGGEGLPARVPRAARPEEERDLDPVLGSERRHLRDLGVGQHHHAGPLGDPAYGHAPLGRLVQNGAEAPPAPRPRGSRSGSGRRRRSGPRSRAKLHRAGGSAQPPEPLGQRQRREVDGRRSAAAGRPGKRPRSTGGRSTGGRSARAASGVHRGSSAFGSAGGSTGRSTGASGPEARAAAVPVLGCSCGPFGRGGAVGTTARVVRPRSRAVVAAPVSRGLDLLPDALRERRRASRSRIDACGATPVARLELRRAHASSAARQAAR